MLIIEYPKCSTCRKAKRWLENHKIEYEDRDIIKDNPQKEELTEWIEKSELPIKRFFNTSGKKYRELKLKDKLPEMTREEQIELLATDGMLVKRPIIITENTILTGFKEKEWEEKLL
ncbi:MAG: ArsC family transcriptional regulator [Methanosphaera sp. rholeuAM270]|nr:MAG: ArsC family transcriptional regulator [Methanosphaera sp. rholeuAM270]